MEQKLKQDLSIGHNIRVLRQRSGLTQEQVAARLQLQGVDLTRDFYAHIETGRYNIRISELAALRRIFSCTFEDFFQGIE